MDKKGRSALLMIQGPKVEVLRNFSAPLLMKISTSPVIPAIRSHPMKKVLETASRAEEIYEN
jgi:hypothetical protein